ncbi:DUF6251 family protein [Streptomyces sp. NPDC006879]|uniref:DUF6251 family protein n=1 Tax=Streptomyces sp. NPDC006879 TaxID=3364767 RepID=UPI0036866CC4
MNSLPEPIHGVVQLPNGTYAYSDQLPAAVMPAAGPQVVHQHIHQAPPDRTMQRLALGAGMGGGVVTAGVYFGPLLVGALTAIAADMAMLAFLALILAWAVRTVVKSTGSAEGAAAVENLRKARRRDLRRRSR